MRQSYLHPSPHPHKPTFIRRESEGSTLMGGYTWRLCSWRSTYTCTGRGQGGAKFERAGDNQHARSNRWLPQP